MGYRGFAVPTQAARSGRHHGVERTPLPPGNYPMSAVKTAL